MVSLKILKNKKRVQTLTVWPMACKSETHHDGKWKLKVQANEAKCEV